MVTDTSPPPRVRPVHAHDMYEPYDGPPLPAPTRDTATGQLTQQQVPLNDRISSIAAGDKDEAENLILQTLHQFVLARTPSDVIARNMGMSMRSLRDWKAKLREKLRNDAKTKDPHDYIGPMIAEMEEVKATAWREVVSAPTKEWSRRMRGLDTIMKVNSELSRLLQVAGMFDNMPMRQPLQQTDTEDGGASTLKDMAQNFLTGGYASNAHLHRSLRPGDNIVDNDDAV